MACSHCGSDQHNIQRCLKVRRCGHCNRAGHDRRNCPKLHPARHAPAHTEPTRPAPPSVIATPTPATLQAIHQIQEAHAREPDLLAHLYWRARQPYFEESRAAHAQEGPWRLKATPGHGVHTPDRPTLNLFVVDEKWIAAYTLAAETRDLRHGLLIKRSALAALAARPGYELVRVKVGHPGKFGESDPEKFWQFDLGNHRFTALDSMRYSVVERLATPEAVDARYLDIPHGAVTTWW